MEDPQRITRTDQHLFVSVIFAILGVSQGSYMPRSLIPPPTPIKME